MLQMNIEYWILEINDNKNVTTKTIGITCYTPTFMHLLEWPEAVVWPSSPSSFHLSHYQRPSFSLEVFQWQVCIQLVPWSPHHQHPSSLAFSSNPPAADEPLTIWPSGPILMWEGISWVIWQYSKWWGSGCNSTGGAGIVTILIFGPGSRDGWTGASATKHCW